MNQRSYQHIFPAVLIFLITLIENVDALAGSLFFRLKIKKGADSDIRSTVASICVDKASQTTNTALSCKLLLQISQS